MSENTTTHYDSLDILLVEDDPSIRVLINAVLEKNGNRVTVATTAEEGQGRAMESEFDIIILDLRLPDGNGYDICHNIRKNQIRTPVLFLSAEHETDVKIKCLKVGGDDYLTKPFNNDELIARIEAITRRSLNPAVNNEFACGSLRVDLVGRKTFIGEQEILLTNNEFNLLVYLMKNKNRLVAREELAKNVWDIHFDTQTNYINVYISYLRKKIREHTSEKFIETVRKRGFVLKCE